MNIIPQLNLFSDNDFDELGDLERLQRVLAALPDEELIQKLNQIRGNGRNDWPVIGMWNAFLASFLFNHETVEQLLRELRRNKQLCAVCCLKAVGRRQPNPYNAKRERHRPYYRYLQQMEGRRRDTSVQKHSIGIQLQRRRILCPR